MTVVLRPGRMAARATLPGLATVLVMIGGAACTPVYDAQLDDRATELEAFRTEFLPATDRVQFLTGASAKVFWVSLEKPLDEPMLHSFDTVTSARVDYEFTRDDTNIAEHYHVGDKLVAKCNYGTSTAFDANASNTLIATTTGGHDLCAIEGDAVYFSVAREIVKWMPAAGTLTTALAIDTALGAAANQIAGFAVLGDQALLAEGPRLWLANLRTGTARFLDNTEHPATGKVDFDARGVAFDSQRGVTYLAFADGATILMSDAIADGGYSLNYKHGDVQDIADTGSYTLSAGHLVYRGTGGIFAYGFDSRKVVDLLLDRGVGYEATPRYGAPVVTTDGTLFVQDTSQISSDSVVRPVYRVGLSGRLR